MPHDYTSTATDSVDISIWNPKAVANWSLLMSPVFGAWLQMLNWRRLGEKGSEQVAAFWLFLSLVFYVALPFVAGANTQPGEQSSLNSGLGASLLYTIAWYFLHGNSQVQYTSKLLGTDYPKRSWWLPLLLGFVFKAGYQGYYYLAFNIVGKAG